MDYASVTGIKSVRGIKTHENIRRRGSKLGIEILHKLDT